VNTSAKGRRLEHRVRDLLLADCQAEHTEAVVVMRAAGSRGPFDLLACCWRCGRIEAVQVKANAWPRAAEWQRLVALGKSAPSNWSIGAVRWDDRMGALWRWAQAPVRGAWAVVCPVAEEAG
jgi:hypothetical protein